MDLKIQLNLSGSHKTMDKWKPKGIFSASEKGHIKEIKLNPPCQKQKNDNGKQAESSRPATKGWLQKTSRVLDVGYKMI